MDVTQASLTTAIPDTLEQRKRHIGQQIDRATDFLRRRYSAEQFILYFQAYSNTFGSIAELCELYEYALSYQPFLEFSVATRPDCIDEEVLDLLCSMKERFRLQDIWIDLGLQSAWEPSLREINRGHGVQDFTEALARIHRRGFKVCAHVILGLPGEGYEQFRYTAAYLSRLLPEAVKIHNLHVPVGTVIHERFIAGELTTSSTERHLSYTIDFLEHLPPEIIISRLVCDTPSHRLASPRRFAPKGSFIQRLERELEQRDTWQGRSLEQRRESEP